jgi:hypothetical protein
VPEADHFDSHVRAVAERMTGKPSYLATDEEWAAAAVEAERTYEPPKPESNVERACRIASGRLQGEEIEQSIRNLNKVSAALFGKSSR